MEEPVNERAEISAVCGTEAVFQDYRRVYKVERIGWIRGPLSGHILCLRYMQSGCSLDL